LDREDTKTARAPKQRKDKEDTQRKKRERTKTKREHMVLNKIEPLQPGAKENV
jgi:hypothetical protein